MSNIKLIVTDLDGTVALHNASEVSARVRDTLVACEEQGVRVAPVTARSLALARDLLLVLGVEGLGVFDNGATVADIKSGTVVWKRWLSVELTRQLATLFLPHASRINYEEIDHVPFADELEFIKTYEQQAPCVYARVPAERAAEITAQLQEIEDITFWSAPDKHTDGVQTEFLVAQATADKYHGVAALREVLRIDKEHTLAIGDGINDLPLFANAGLRVAMGNAVDELKALADHIVAPVERDGWADAMEHFVLDRPVPPTPLGAA